MNNELKTVEHFEEMSREKGLEFMKFECTGEVDICEAFHVGIIKEMTTGKPFDFSKKERTLEYYKTLITVALQPHDGDYNIYVSGSHIAIDRAKKIGVMEEGTRLGVVGVTH